MWSVKDTKNLLIIWYKWNDWDWKRNEIYSGYGILNILTAMDMVGESNPTYVGFFALSLRLVYLVVKRAEMDWIHW